MNFEPLFSTPEFQIPEGFPGVPEVELWKLASQTHSILSPVSIVIVAGEKVSPLLPTSTVNVLAKEVSPTKRERAPASPKMKRRVDNLMVAEGDTTFRTILVPIRKSNGAVTVSA